MIVEQINVNVCTLDHLLDRQKSGLNCELVLKAKHSFIKKWLFGTEIRWSLKADGS